MAKTHGAKTRGAEERLAEAQGRVERYRNSAERHHRASERHHSRGDTEKATAAERLAERAEKLQRKWATAARRLDREITTQRILDGRAPTRAPVTTTPDMSAKERREQEKRRKEMATAAVEWDPRTAQGRRTFHLARLGASMRASISHFEACFRKRIERTDSRVLAWARFDEHCHKVNAGGLPSPRYEPGVDVSTVPGVSDSRLDAARDDRHLRRFLGEYMHGLMVQVIYHQRPFADLAGLYGEEEAIAAIFARALDLYAAHESIGPANEKARQMNSALFKVQAAEQG